MMIFSPLFFDKDLFSSSPLLTSLKETGNQSYLFSDIIKVQEDELAAASDHQVLNIASPAGAAIESPISLSFNKEGFRLLFQSLNELLIGGNGSQKTEKPTSEAEVKQFLSLLFQSASKINSNTNKDLPKKLDSFLEENNGIKEFVIKVKPASLKVEIGIVEESNSGHDYELTSAKPDEKKLAEYDQAEIEQVLKEVSAQISSELNIVREELGYNIDLQNQKIFISLPNFDENGETIEGEYKNIEISRPAASQPLSGNSVPAADVPASSPASSAAPVITASAVNDDKKSAIENGNGTDKKVFRIEAGSQQFDNQAASKVNTQVGNVDSFPFNDEDGLPKQVSIGKEKIGSFNGYAEEFEPQKQTSKNNLLNFFDVTEEMLESIQNATAEKNAGPKWSISVSMAEEKSGEKVKSENGIFQLKIARLVNESAEKTIMSDLKLNRTQVSQVNSAFQPDTKPVGPLAILGDEMPASQSGTEKINGANLKLGFAGLVIVNKADVAKDTGAIETGSDAAVKKFPETNAALEVKSLHKETELEKVPARSEEKAEGAVSNNKFSLKGGQLDGFDEAKGQTLHFNNIPVRIKNESQAVNSETEERAVKPVKGETEELKVNSSHTGKGAEAENNHSESFTKTGGEQITKNFDMPENLNTSHRITSPEFRAEIKEQLSYLRPGIDETIKTVKAAEVVNEISKFLNRADKQSITFQLMPETLGQVKLSIDLVENQMNAQIQVENEQVRQIIQSNSEQLKSSLQSAGIVLNNLDVSLNNSANQSSKAAKNKKKMPSGADEAVQVEEENAGRKKMMGYNTYEYLA